MIEVGMTHQKAWVVADEHLASRYGSGLVDALATPVLVGLCEECARMMVEPHLAQGQKTVGTAIQLDHLAATPPGLRVIVTAKLVEIDRTRLRFDVEARDEIEPIARASHERFIIDTARFERRIQEKLRNATSAGEQRT